MVVSTSYSYVNFITQLLRLSHVCSSDMMFVGFIKFMQEMEFEISVVYHSLPALFKRMFFSGILQLKTRKIPTNKQQIGKDC